MKRRTGVKDSVRFGVNVVDFYEVCGDLQSALVVDAQTQRSSSHVRITSSNQKYSKVVRHLYSLCMSSMDT